MTADLDAEFLTYLEEQYQENKERAQKRLSGKTMGGDLSVYVLGVALLTYGRIDVIDDILQNVPARDNPARILTRVVDALIPLPGNLDSVGDPLATLSWINENRPRLKWFPAQGRFQLSNS